MSYQEITPETGRNGWAAHTRFVEVEMLVSIAGSLAGIPDRSATAAKTFFL